MDKAEGGHYIARTEFDSLEVDYEVLIPIGPSPDGGGREGAGNYLRIGDFAEVRITEANEHDLRGEVVQP